MRAALAFLTPLLLASVLALAASPASANVLPDACPCWDKGGPFYTPSVWCYDSTRIQFGFITGTFAQTVDFGAFSYCRNNALFRWTTPGEHQSCIHSLHLACSDILAQAYIDRNNNNAFDRGDGLIAKLVDVDDSGTANAGDTLVSDVYPTSLASPPPEAAFAGKAVVCSGGASAVPGGVQCIDSTPSVYTWIEILTPAGGREEFGATGAGFIHVFADWIDPFRPDRILMGTSPGPPSPLAPALTPITESATRAGDQNFLDVNVFVSP